MKAARSEFIELNGLRYHVRRWGDPTAPTVLMLHGWMDMSATFQFLVDALEHEWNIIAPDWPGFGLSDHDPRGYSLLQYCAQLDLLLNYYSPDKPVRLVAHSMGANVSNVYLAARPERFTHYVNIEGYAPVPDFFEGTPGQIIGRWLDHAKSPKTGRPYTSHTDLAKRLEASNRRLLPERAAFLAKHLGVIGDDGLVRISADPAARFFAPLSLHREQIMDLWSEINIPVLCVRGGKSFITRAFIDRPDDLPERIAAFKQGQEALLPEGTHNLHHELPEQLASLIGNFFR